MLTGSNARFYARVPARRARKRAQRGANVPHYMFTMSVFFCARNLSSPRHAVGANDARALLPAACGADARTRCTAAHDCRLLAASAFRAGAATALVSLGIIGIAFCLRFLEVEIGML